MIYNLAWEYDMKQVIFLGFTFALLGKFFFSKNFLSSKEVSFHGVSLSEITKETLVVTDINDTIVTCTESFWQKETMNSLSGSAKEKLLSLSSARKNLLANLVMQKCANKEITGASHFFNSLKEKKIPTLALTAAFAEALDGVDMSELVRKELRNISIHFEGPLRGKRVFSELKRDIVSGGYPTLLEEGALLLNGTANTKGEALRAYINALPEASRPKKVLFFDDSDANLKSVAKEIKALGLEVRTIKASDVPAGITKPSSNEEKIWESLIDRSLL